MSFTYDPLGRLTGYSGAPVTSQAYGWDAVPNRTTKQVGTDPAVTTTFDLANRPTSDSAGGAYTSDLDGRLTAMPGYQLVWDALGRLTQVKDAFGTPISTYAYDPLDRLASVTRGSAVTRFRYKGTTPTISQARDGAGTVLWNVATSLAGAGLMDFGPGGSAQRFYGANGHGDLTWTADASGAVTATLRYDPWGIPGASSGSSFPDFRFQGSWSDTATGLSWAVARWYAPTIGRFISEDTLRGQTDRPESRHLYAYGAGEPVGRVDPDGEYWYVIRSGDTLASIAARYMTSSSYWPMVYNANRTNTSAVRSTSLIYAGACLWVPKEWVSSNIPASDPRCSGRARPRSAVKAFNAASGDSVPSGWGWSWQTETAAERLGIFGGFLNMSPQRLYSLTKKWTNRDPDLAYAQVKPSVDDWFNPLARDVIRRNGGSVLGYWPNGWRLNDIRLVYGNRAWPSAFHAGAFTMGDYIFISDNPAFAYAPPRWLVSHEYVHVLQYEGFGWDLAIDYGYFAYVRGIGGSPWNPYEAIAYLWQAYTYAYGPASWDVFWRPAP